MVSTLLQMRCLSSQRYNFLKANHNASSNIFLIRDVVYQVKDTIFWKQITTKDTELTIIELLFIKSKIQFFESKSQLLQKHLKMKIRCLSSQRYNFLKANHNYTIYVRLFLQVVYQVKDTIFWKQITTKIVAVFAQKQLFIKSKIQFFESKSQRDYISFTY